MLIDFALRNFGPFKDQFVFSMVPTALEGDEAQLVPMNDSESLLCSAAIFGANASGKSYVFKALETLQLMVRAPMNPNIKYPWYQPFRASKDTFQAPTAFVINFLQNEIRYEYSISFVSDHVVSESLYHYPKGKRALVFERVEQRFRFGRSTMKGLTASSKLVSPSSSFLAVAAQYNSEVCMAAHKGIVGEILLLGGDSSYLLNEVIEHMNTHPGSKDLLLRALSIADFGISDFFGTVQKKEVTEFGNKLPPQIVNLAMMSGSTELAQTTMYLEHDFAKSDAGKDLLRYPFQIESNGTLQFFCIMGPIIDALENGYTVVVDEFGTYLHSDLAKWILSQFRSPANPHRAQIIVNTQDQSLLSLDLFRRDQVWFTQKDRDTGASKLYCLSDFNGVRADIDLQKSYSVNKFGGMPFIRDEDVLP